VHEPKFLTLIQKIDTHNRCNDRGGGRSAGIWRPPRPSGSCSRRRLRAVGKSLPAGLAETSSICRYLRLKASCPAWEERGGSVKGGLCSFLRFRIDPANQCLWRRGDSAEDERVLLTPKAYAVLDYLLKHPVAS